MGKRIRRRGEIKGKRLEQKSVMKEGSREKGKTRVWKGGGFPLEFKKKKTYGVGWP